MSISTTDNYDFDFEEPVESLPDNAPSRKQIPSFKPPALPKSLSTKVQQLFSGAKIEPSPKPVSTSGNVNSFIPVTSNTDTTSAKRPSQERKSMIPRRKSQDPAEQTGSVRSARSGKRGSKSNLRGNTGNVRSARRKPHSPSTRLRPHLSQYLFEAEEITKLTNMLNEERAKNKELFKEVKTLQQLQKRQEKALTKMDSNQEDFPKVIEKLQSEIKAIKVMNNQYKEKISLIERQSKTSTEEILRLRDKCHKYEETLRDRNLEGSDRLLEETRKLKDIVKDREQKLMELNKEKSILLASKDHEIKSLTAEKKNLQREVEHLTLVQRELLDRIQDSQKKLAVTNIYARVNPTEVDDIVSVSKIEEKRDDGKEKEKSRFNVLHETIGELFSGSSGKKQETSVKKQTAIPQRETKEKEPSQKPKAVSPEPTKIIETPISVAKPKPDPAKPVEVIEKSKPEPPKPIEQPKKEEPPKRAPSPINVAPEPAPKPVVEVVPQPSIFKPALTAEPKPAETPAPTNPEPTAQSSFFVTTQPTQPPKLSLFGSTTSSSPFKPSFFKFGSTKSPVEQTQPKKPVALNDVEEPKPPSPPPVENEPEIKPVVEQEVPKAAPIPPVEATPRQDLNKTDSLPNSAANSKESVNKSAPVQKPWEKLHASLPVSATDTELTKQKMKAAETKLKELEKTYPDGSDLETFIVKKRKEELRKELAKLNADMNDGAVDNDAKGPNNSIELNAKDFTSTTMKNTVVPTPTNTVEPASVAKPHKLDFLDTFKQFEETYTPSGTNTGVKENTSPPKLSFLSSLETGASSGPKSSTLPNTTSPTLNGMSSQAPASAPAVDNSYTPSFMLGGRNRRGMAATVTSSVTTTTPSNNTFASVGLGGSKSSETNTVEDDDLPADIEEEVVAL